MVFITGIRKLATNPDFQTSDFFYSPEYSQIQLMSGKIIRQYEYLLLNDDVKTETMTIFIKKELLDLASVLERKWKFL